MKLFPNVLSSSLMFCSIASIWFFSFHFFTLFFLRFITLCIDRVIRRTEWEVEDRRTMAQCHSLSLSGSTLQLPRHWPISRSNRSHDLAGQSEFFVPVSRLQTFYLLHGYRQLTVNIVVSAIAVFRLVYKGDSYLISSDYPQT